MVTSELYTNFCSSLISACDTLFGRFSFVLVSPKQRKIKMAEMNLGEVVLRCVSQA